MKNKYLPTAIGLLHQSYIIHGMGVIHHIPESKSFNGTVGYGSQWG